MPVLGAPTIDLLPTAAGRFSAPLTFSTPTAAPIVPRLAPRALNAATRVPTAIGMAGSVGAVTRLIGTAGLVVQAGVTGFRVGNYLYEEVLERPFGPSVGDYLGWGEPRPQPLVETQPVQPGSTPGVAYWIDGSVLADRYSTADYRTYYHHLQRTGPIGELVVTHNANNVLLLMDGEVQGNLGNTFTGINNVRWAEGSPTIYRVDGETEASPQSEPSAHPVGSPLTYPDFPPALHPPAFPNGLPQLVPTTSPQPNPVASPAAEALLEALPELLALVGIDLALPVLSHFPNSLPEREPARPQPSPPTPNPQCCPTLERGNSRLESLLRQVLEKLAGEGLGSLDLTPCGVELPVTLPYGGDGLDGIYSALSAIAQALNTIHTDTKCPPEAVAALPMHWDAKRGEIPQLSVIWRKVEGGGSTWSMTIPHPRAEIGPDYPFNFPEYIKGGNMASIRLTDNSQCIVNAFSESEAQKVIDYLTTLIDPAYLPETGVRMIYSKNVGGYAEVSVRAEYVKKFQGHKNTAPQWGQRIVE